MIKEFIDKGISYSCEFPTDFFQQCTSDPFVYALDYIKLNDSNLFNLIINNSKYKTYEVIKMFSKSKDRKHKMEIIIDLSGNKVVNFYSKEP